MRGAYAFAPSCIAWLGCSHLSLSLRTNDSARAQNIRTKRTVSIGDLEVANDGIGHKWPQAAFLDERNLGYFRLRVKIRARAE
jgi:hypothetical protein